MTSLNIVPHLSNNPLKLEKKKYLTRQLFSGLHHHNPPPGGGSTIIKRAHAPHKGGVRKIRDFFFRMKLELKVRYIKIVFAYGCIKSEL